MLPFMAPLLLLAFLFGGAFAGASSAFLRPFVVELFFLPLPLVFGLASSSSDIILASLPPRPESIDPAFPLDIWGEVSWFRGGAGAGCACPGADGAANWFVF